MTCTNYRVATYAKSKKKNMPSCSNKESSRTSAQTLKPSRRKTCSSDSLLVKWWRRSKWITQRRDPSSEKCSSSKSGRKKKEKNKRAQSEKRSTSTATLWKTRTSWIERWSWWKKQRQPGSLRCISREPCSNLIKRSKRWGTSRWVDTSRLVVGASRWVVGMSSWVVGMNRWVGTNSRCQISRRKTFIPSRCRLSTRCPNNKTSIIHPRPSNLHLTKSSSSSSSTQVNRLSSKTKSQQQGSIPPRSRSFRIDTTSSEATLETKEQG